jgi:AraC-like DNA-binding protein
LPEDFSILLHPIYEQGDQPITWLHVHDCVEIGYCYEGDGVFVIGGKVLPFHAGDVSVITSAEVHLAQSVPGTRSRWAWIYFDPFRLLHSFGRESALLDIGVLAGREFHNIISPQRDRFVGQIVQELVTELQENKRDYRAMVRGLTLSLLARLGRLTPVEPSAEDHGAAVRRIAPALDRMAECYASPADVRKWARDCRMSVTSFRRLFRQALGKSPHQYLIELRTLMAASRLQAGREKIVDIAYATGFATLSSFNRSFLRVMGQTPSRWRRHRNLDLS